MAILLYEKNVDEGIRELAEQEKYQIIQIDEYFYMKMNEMQEEALIPPVYWLYEGKWLFKDVGSFIPESKEGLCIAKWLFEDIKREKLLKIVSNEDLFENEWTEIFNLSVLSVDIFKLLIGLREYPGSLMQFTDKSNIDSASLATNVHLYSSINLRERHIFFYRIAPIFKVPEQFLEGRGLLYFGII